MGEAWARPDFSYTLLVQYGLRAVTRAAEWHADGLGPRRNDFKDILQPSRAQKVTQRRLRVGQNETDAPLRQHTAFHAEGPKAHRIHGAETAAIHRDPLQSGHGIQPKPALQESQIPGTQPQASELGRGGRRERRGR